jgi:hypothetical protein
VTPRGTSRASSTSTFGDIASDPALMVGMFYGDSKTRPFPYLAHSYLSRLSAALSGPNVVTVTKRTFQSRRSMSAFRGKVDMALNDQNVRFREERHHPLGRRAVQIS